MRSIHHHLSVGRKFNDWACLCLWQPAGWPTQGLLSGWIPPSFYSFFPLLTWCNLSDHLCPPLLRFPVAVSNLSASIRPPSISLSHHSLLFSCHTKEEAGSQGRYLPPFSSTSSSELDQSASRQMGQVRSVCCNAQLPGDVCRLHINPWGEVWVWDADLIYYLNARRQASVTKTLPFTNLWQLSLMFKLSLRDNVTSSFQITNITIAPHSTVRWYLANVLILKK